MQDLAFVLVAMFFAQMGGRVGPLHGSSVLRLPGCGLVAAGWLIVAVARFVPAPQRDLGGRRSPEPRRNCSNQLGANEGTALLLLSAALTCVVAPICEEFLFRGFVFTALRNWRGIWPAAVITGLAFGAVHIGSAPALDLVPLAGAWLWAVPALPLYGFAVPVHRGAFAEQLGRVCQPRELEFRRRGSCWSPALEQSARSCWRPSVWV